MKPHVFVGVFIALLCIGIGGRKAAAQETGPTHEHAKPQASADHAEMDHSKMKHNVDDIDEAVSTSTHTDSNVSEKEHVPPDPPQHEIPPMSSRMMMNMMEMDDTKRFAKVIVDQFEWRGGANAFVWDAQGWYGGDYNKLWAKTEGERARASTDAARAELFWDRIVARWWSLQAGARHDFGEGPTRNWAAIGIEGIAPYWFDVEATAYVGEGGRTAARIKTEYDLLFSQRLIMQPEAEVNLYGKEDRERNIGSGLSDLELSLRLRYEIRREVAPYIGVTLVKRFGATASLARAAGEDVNAVRATLGMRIWF